MKITHDKLEELLLSVKGNTYVTASVITPVKLKGGSPYKGKTVLQKQTIQGQVGYIYQNSINNAEAKAGIPEEERTTSEDIKQTWGTVSENRAVAYHTPKDTTEQRRYLRIKAEKKLQRDDDAYFLEDGTEVPKEVVKEWKYQPKRSSTQDNLPEGVEIPARRILFENIKSINLLGGKYEVVK